MIAADITSLLLDVQRFTSPVALPEEVLSSTMALNQFALQLDLDNMQLANGTVLAYWLNREEEEIDYEDGEYAGCGHGVSRRLEYGYYD